MVSGVPAGLKATISSPGSPALDSLAAAAAAEKDDTPGQSWHGRSRTAPRTRMRHQHKQQQRPHALAPFLVSTHICHSWQRALPEEFLMTDRST